jgi:nicotinamidase/pyrazinamidase
VMKTVFLDIDTQLDFLYPAGALYVPGSEDIVPNLAALTRHGVSRGHQIIASVDAHSEDDPEFKIWKPHCVVGTTGQLKAVSALCERPLVVSSAPDALEPLVEHLPNAKQIIIEKQLLDCFSNPNLIRLLDALEPKRFVVYGVATEYCVRCAVEGLLGHGKPIYLVSDAIRSIDREAGEKLLKEFSAKGVELRETADVIADNWG